MTLTVQMTNKDIHNLAMMVKENLEFEMGIQKDIVSSAPSVRIKIERANLQINESITDRSNDPDTKKIFQAAVNHFGKTYDLREAGFVLPDGTMLDFSGKHKVHDYRSKKELSGQRVVDHKDIDEINYLSDGNTKSGLDVHITDFVERGAIRVDSNAGAINIALRPTPEQLRVIREIINRNDGDVWIDFGNTDEVDHYVEYSGSNPKKIIADILKYFDEGIKPLGDNPDIS